MGAVELEKNDITIGKKISPLVKKYRCSIFEPEYEVICVGCRLIAQEISNTYHYAYPSPTTPVDDAINAYHDKNAEERTPKDTSKYGQNKKEKSEAA